MIQQRLASFSDGLEEYGKAMDVFVNSYPEILSPIWGSIRVVMLTKLNLSHRQIASEAGKFQDKLVDMFAQIADVLPRLQVYEMIFKDHERVLWVISDAYLDVVNFCIYAKHLFARKPRSMIPLSITLKAAWKPFQKEFDDYMVTFRGHRKRADREAKVAHMIGAAKSREIELRNQVLQKRNYRLGRRHEILSDLTNINYSAKHVVHLSLRHPGTNLWMGNGNGNERLSLWLASQESKMICCYGIPGSGKSVLAASVVEDLLATNNGPTSITCYYYCDYADIASLDIAELVACLAKQVLIRLPLDRFDDGFDCPFKQGVHPRLSESQEFLLRILGEYTHTFVIIDGLDELDKHNQSATMAFIDQLISVPNTVTKVFATSRSEESIVRNAFGDNSVDLLSLAFHNDNINRYIETHIETKVEPANPLLDNQRLRQGVLDGLFTYTKGMFLFAKLQLDEIQEAMTEKATREIIVNFPKGLDGIYARIIRRIGEGPGGDTKLSMASKAFRWIACARRPLSLPELEEAVGIDKTDTFLRADNIARNTGSRLISACGNLLTCDESSGIVTFVHRSVLQFLRMEPREAYEKYHHQIHFNITEADREIGEICIAYLSFSDFETQIATLPGTAQLDRSYAEGLVQGSVKQIFGTALKFNPFGSRSKSQSSPLTIPLPVSLKASETLATKYLLLEYIITHWAFHTRSFDQTDPSWPVFSDLALSRLLMFEFRPWNEHPWHRQIEILASEYKKLFIQNAKEAKYKSNQRTMDSLLEHLPVIFWALNYGIRSLILLLEDRLINSQGICASYEIWKESYLKLQESTSWMKFSPYGPWITLFFHLCEWTKPQHGSQSFWNGRYILGAEKTMEWSWSSLVELSNVIGQEFRRWKSLRPDADMEYLFEDAALITLRKNREMKLTNIINIMDELDFSFSLGPRKRIFIAMVQMERSWSKALHLIFFFDDVFHAGSKIEGLDFIFAFEQQLSLVARWCYQEGLVIRNNFDPYGVCTEHIGLILALLISSNNNDIERYIQPIHILMYRDGLRKYRLRLPTHDWTRTTLGSMEVFQKLLAIDGMSLLGIDLRKAYGKAPIVSSRTRWLREIAHLVQDGTSFSTSKLEDQGIVTANALSIFHSMMRHYDPEAGFPVGFADINWTKKAVKLILAQPASKRLAQRDEMVLRLLLDEDHST
ncbi:hypothetical protein BS50DRAFT_616287 [Corynespora cassiicola Philippines]|uniref:NACHT domain-containing protein n=1 Tax=Corynespora cassiicola Philippines TaxID=1448308 RepID=A0A2T2P526_CORCC|nr:hypothetical protein BS50DRAFT_616287 [Corynespora cassiicola Philippines]